MQIDWRGHYLDGRSAARQPVRVRLMQSGIEIVLPDGATRFWPLHDTRQTQGSYAGEQVRLERSGELPEALVIDDRAFVNELRRQGVKLTGASRRPEDRRARARFVAAAVVGVCALAAGYLWGLPVFVKWVAPRVPVMLEEEIGRAAVDDLVPPERLCEESLLTRRVQEIMERLVAAAWPQPYGFTSSLANQPLVNAFAMPGGYIVVYRGLIEQTDRPEELAGVLAHEIRHITLRHTTQQMLHNATAGILIAMLTGGDSGGAFGLQAAHVLGSMRYSRGHEAEADREAVSLLIAAGIDPHGLISFFEVLKREEGEIPDGLKYFSTHPQTEERIQALTAYVEQHSPALPPLFPEDDWKAVRGLCRATADTSPNEQPTLTRGAD